MRFIRVWAYGCAKYLAEHLKENHQKRGIYYYSFQIMISNILEVSALILISLILGIFGVIAVTLLTFVIMRSAAGGYHMDTYGKCMMASLALFILTGLIAQYTGAYWSMTVIILFIALSFVLSIYIIAKWAPRDNPHKPITDPKEIRKLKGLSYTYLLIWLFTVLLLSYFKLNSYVLSLCFALLVEMFTISPAGYAFFDWISGSVNLFNRKNSDLPKRRQ